MRNEDKNLLDVQASHTITQHDLATSTIVRAKKAIAMTGKCRSSFYEIQRETSPYFDPTFPPRVQIGPRSVGYFLNQIEAWLLTKQASLPKKG